MIFRYYNFFFIIFFLSLLSSPLVLSKEMFVLDDLTNSGKTLQNQEWSFFTDGVMGGLSQGNVSKDNISGKSCYRMQGNVTTENNGGFIQIVAPIKPIMKAKDFEGVYIKVFGNNKRYFLHIRTPLTLAPWQYYSFSFESSSNFYQPKTILNQKIKTIGVLAGFDNYQADICIAEIGFY
jgi:hypothetical protein